MTIIPVNTIVGLRAQIQWLFSHNMIPYMYKCEKYERSIYTLFLE